MKYKLFLESEYNDWEGDLEPSKVVDSSDLMIDYEVGQFCKYLYSERDGWEWMKNSDDRIIAIDESGDKRYFVFELDYEPIFFVMESETK
jgi:hypothetical protein